MIDAGVGMINNDTELMLCWMMTVARFGCFNCMRSMNHVFDRKDSSVLAEEQALRDCVVGTLVLDLTVVWSRANIYLKLEDRFLDY